MKIPFKYRRSVVLSGVLATATAKYAGSSKSYCSAIIGIRLNFLKNNKKLKPNALNIYSCKHCHVSTLPSFFLSFLDIQAKERYN